MNLRTHSKKKTNNEWNTKIILGTVKEYIIICASESMAPVNRHVNDLESRLRNKINPIYSSYASKIFIFTNKTNLFETYSLHN